MTHTKRTIPLTATTTTTTTTTTTKTVVATATTVIGMMTIAIIATTTLTTRTTTLILRLSVLADMEGGASPNVNTPNMPVVRRKETRGRPKKGECRKRKVRMA